MGRVSLLALITGLFFSLFALMKTNSLSGQVIGSLGEQAQKAEQTARRASGASEKAAIKAIDAQDQAAAAQIESSKAKDAAERAGLEAGSFGREIIAAKKQAAKAEQALTRYAADRGLTDDQQAHIASQLPLTPRQGVTVGALPATAECEKLAKEIFASVKMRWGANFIADSLLYPYRSSGVGIFTTHDPRSVKAAEIQVRALSSEGIVSLRSDELFLPGCEGLTNLTAETLKTDPVCYKILVVVGPKPPITE